MADQVSHTHMYGEGSKTIATSVRDINNYHTTTNNHRPTPEPSAIYFDVRDPEVNFVGRLDELSHLQDELKTSSTSSATKRMIAVSGLGGIGKTQLIRKFIDINRDSYKNVIWINSENTATIKDSFKRLALDRLNIQTTHEDGKEKNFLSIVESVFTRLSEKKTLIVYDNVDEIGDIKFILTIQSSGTKLDVLITSRIQKWGRQIHIVPLKVWEIDDAIEYITITLEDPDSIHKDTHDDKKLLVKKLQAFPLALKQATAYINHQREVERFCIADYIANYDTQEILDSTLFYDDPLNIYEKTTFTTWRVTIDAIKQDGAFGLLAVRILQIIAFFNPEDIPRDIFVHLPFDTEDQKLCKKIKIDYKQHVIAAVRLLVNYSMVDSQKQQSVLSVHRLVQKVIKLESEQHEKKAILRDSLLLVPKLIDNFKLHGNHSHAISVFLSALKFNELVTEFSGMPNEILTTLILSGKYNRAEEFAKNIFQPLMNILGQDHPDTLTCKHNIAQSLTHLGKHTEAHQMYKEVVEKAENVLGEEHPLTLTTKHRIAGSLTHLGRYTEALHIYQDVFEKRKNILGEDDLDTLRSKHQVALSLIYLGKYTEALQIFEDVLEKRKTILGEEHPQTIANKHNIALSLERLGRYNEALKIYQDVLEKDTNVLTEDHPDTLTTKYEIAYLHGRLGKHLEALQMYQELYEKRKNILGEDHPETLRCKHQIAYSQGHLGKHIDALQTFHEVIEKRKNILGEDHPDTLRSKHQIANSNAALGKYTDALEIYQDVFEKRKNVLGGDHPETLTSKHQIALSLRHLGRHVESLQIYKEVYDKAKNVLREDDPLTIATKSEIESLSKE